MVDRIFFFKYISYSLKEILFNFRNISLKKNKYFYKIAPVTNFFLITQNFIIL